MSQEARMKELEAKIDLQTKQLQHMAKVLLGTSAFVNLLIKKAGLSEQELERCLIKEAVDGATGQLVRLSEAGATVGDPGSINTAVPGTASDRNDSTGNRDQPDLSKRAQGTSDPAPASN